MFKIINRTVERVGVTGNKGLQIVEVSFDLALQESIDDAIADLKKLTSTQVQRNAHLASIYK